VKFGLDQVEGRLLVRGAICADVSQLGWWGAVGIGFLDSQS
jgi:hypothetical protein